MPSQKPSLYLDTNIFSVLHYRGGDPRVLNQRLITQAWWQLERKRFHIFTSSIVEEELKKGEYGSQEKALAQVKWLPFLPMKSAVRSCIEVYMREKLVPGSKLPDAAHMAMATVHGINYLLSWNQAHLANASTQLHLATLNRTMHYRTPKLVSPETIPKASFGQELRRSDREEK